MLGSAEPYRYDRRVPTSWMRRLTVVLAVGGVFFGVLASPAGAAERALPALTPGPPDGLTRALQRGEIPPASYALWRAQALFHPAAVRARFGSVLPVNPDAGTLVLRDLVARYRQLDPSDQAEALRILARPDDGRSDPQGDGYSVPSRYDCTADFCVHWVDTTADAPSPTDANGNGIPDYVETVEQVTQTVWDTEVGKLGYRPPLPDDTSLNHGPDGKLDIYLADLGNDGLYGYCTTDDPRAFTGTPGPVSAYCVVDNDFSPAQYSGYGGATGVQALEVTVAHEFFHAIQAGYNLFNDLVLVEGTAVWMEDEVYNDINDNYYYLKFSALKRPGVPFDLAVTNSASNYWGFEYGAFVFYRYLSERFQTPDIIRRIWEFADASPGGKDEYSLQAIDSALRERGTTFRDAFADWTAANAFPAAFYSEGAAYPVPPKSPKETLVARTAHESARLKLDHLTSHYIEFVPGPRLKANARLRIQLALPTRGKSGAATVLCVSPSGAITAVRAQLTPTGTAVVTVPFNRSKVSSVVLVLTNAGADYSCGHGTAYACNGVPLDDHLTFRYTAKVA